MSSIARALAPRSVITLETQCRSGKADVEGPDLLLPSLVVLDVLSKVVHCDGKYERVLRAQ